MRIAAIASWPRRRASEPKFSDKKSGETITRAATFLAIGSALVPGMNRSSRNSRVCDAGPSMQPPTAANCAVRPNFFSDETLSASMLWQIKSPVVNEMQTADMEREYARPVSICAIEFAIPREVPVKRHRGDPREPGTHTGHTGARGPVTKDPTEFRVGTRKRPIHTESCREWLHSSPLESLPASLHARCEPRVPLAGLHCGQLPCGQRVFESAAAAAVAAAAATTVAHRQRGRRSM